MLQFYNLTVATEEERRFFSFHEWGILVYEPSTCHALHEIRSTDIIPGTQVRSWSYIFFLFPVTRSRRSRVIVILFFFVHFQEYVCGPKNVPCSWGRAINIANRYVYVSQPDKDRVLVISEVQMMIIDVRVFFLLL